MKPLNVLETVLLAGGLLLTVGLPAVAGSPQTDAFVARIRPDVDMLDRSSRLALDTSHDPALRRFAHREVIEQTIAANSLVAWSQTNTLAGAEVAIGTPLTPASAVPAVADVTGSAVLTGRSVAIDRPLTVTRAPNTGSDGGSSTAFGTSDEDALARLSTLKGAAFDGLYREMQRDGLRRLADSYADYKRTGGDPALRALVTRELPKINGMLTELRRF